MAERILELYTGPHCSLCLEAMDILGRLCAGTGWRIVEVDVTGSLELKKAYGLRIPVLKRLDTGAELAWPFDREQAAIFLAIS